MFRWLLYKSVKYGFHSEIVPFSNITFTYDPERCVVEGRPGWRFRRKQPYTHAKWEGKSELRMTIEGRTYIDEVSDLESECVSTPTQISFTSGDPVPADVQGIPFVIRTVRYEILPRQYKAEDVQRRVVRYRIELIGVSEIS